MGSRLASRLCAAFILLVCIPGSASAVSLEDPFNQWLPDSDAATWTYSWTDSEYAQTPTREQYVVTGRTGPSFRLAWSSDGVGNGDGSQSTSGSVDYKRTTAGLIVTNWSASQPPAQFPVLCASATQCGNSLSSTHFMIIWGARSPVLAEPLVTGTAWSTTGGANNDVASANRYIGTELVKVPAFPDGVKAAVVRSDMTQAGALGDPYGSGVRTVWWVWGVGPVKVNFRHTGGPVQDSELVSTNLQPRPAPSDANYLPLSAGHSQDFRWRNSKHMKTWSRQRFTVAQVVNASGRVDVKSLSGPIKVAGSYAFTSRLDGTTSVSTFTKAASKARFPELGPKSQPKARRRHFFTPFDLMTFGYNPVLPPYPQKDQTWSNDQNGPDWDAFGVSGHSKIVGVERVKVKAGTYDALKIESTLSQKGYTFGSGRRESWFAPDKGLVKLVFHHGDGSISTVERLR